MDVGTKYIIAGILVRFLKAAGYFEKDDSKSSEILIGILICITFLAQSVLQNEIIFLEQSCINVVKPLHTQKM